MSTVIDDPVVLPAAEWTRWWKPALGIALALLLFGAGWTVYRLIDGTTAPVQTVHALLADSKVGRGPEVMRRAPVLAQNDGFFMQSVSFRNDVADVEGALITRSGPVPAHFRLFRAGGSWQVTAIDLPGQTLQL
jgi:hypothetical protein